MRSFLAFISCVMALSCATAPVFDDDAGTVPDAGSKPDAAVCPGSQTRCGATCTDTAKDTSNCGQCGVKCKTGEYCAAGKCNAACNQPNLLCGQFCVDVATDHDNCGKCGMGCTSDQECKGKACIKKCPAGLSVCDMDCVAIESDSLHCGDCNTACAMGEICIGSICCKSGLTACNGACTDLQSDQNNCGACGLACGGNTPYCGSGQCKKLSAVVNGFTGNSYGPDFSGAGFAQCAGWKDSTVANEVPDVGWADGCKVQNTTQVRIACGANANNVLYVDLGRNVFNQVLTGYPENNLIVNANFMGYQNVCYAATGNDLNKGVSWLGGGQGCGEANKNLTINNSCQWEASNCFGQNLNGDRYLYVYVK